jgi:oxygen-dependent protoporphyrinogen oxidase
MNKLVLLAVFGLGYVLGARAGRRRYDQIRQKAQQLWNDEHVQSAVHSAGEVVGSAADKVGEKVSEKASDVLGKVRSQSR